MPWKNTSRQEQRYQLILEMLAGERSVSELCRRLRVSRKTAYKWWWRFKKGRLAGLRDRSREPRHVRSRTSALWLERLRRERGKHPTWGARKLEHRLRRDFRNKELPSVAAIGRWLKRWGAGLRTETAPARASGGASGTT